MIITSFSVINCEGDIFAIHFHKNKTTGQALLEDGSGKITFTIQKFEIIKYLFSEITLEDIIQKSSIKEVELYHYNTRSTSTINKKTVGELACGKSLFNDLPNPMKLNFKKRVELAVRANFAALDFQKIWHLVKHCFLLKEKYELLVFTFGENHSVAEKCKKQYIDLRNFLSENEIPIEFVNKDEIESLKLEKADLDVECGLNLHKIGQKDIMDITNIEMNYLVYHLSDLIADLRYSPRFWTKKAKLKYIKEYQDHYIPFKRQITIDAILK